MAEVIVHNGQCYNGWVLVHSGKCCNGLGDGSWVSCNDLDDGSQ